MTDKEYMLDKLSEESDMVIATAYMYAVNMRKFGKDVTEKWLTAVTQTMALEESYVRGRIDSDNEWRERLNDSAEHKTGKWHYYRCSECKKVCTYFLSLSGGSYIIEKRPNYCPYCGARMEVDE